MIPVIIPSVGGRPLVRTADSIARQSVRGAIVLAAAPPHGDPPLVRSVATRLGARIYQEHNLAAAINTAVSATTSEWFAIVPAGLTLAASALAQIDAAFGRHGDAAAVVPAIRMHSADGRFGETWRVPSAVLADALADPRTTPPMIALRRAVWDSVRGLDAELAGLAEYDFWIRLCALGAPTVLLEGALASCDASDAGPIFRLRAKQYGGLSEALADAVGPDVCDADHLKIIRAIYEKHRPLLEREMEAVFVRREIGFARLRDGHRELVQRRDSDLSELDRLRAETEHARAYVRHHGADAVDWGDLRRTDPISRDWGYDRGAPIDRRHIEDFLAAHSSEVRGAVLEVQEDDFTRRFGGRRVTASDVLDIDGGNARATVIADLRCAPEVPSESYDCVILTQTLHVIDDASAVLGECNRILKPGGVLLATVPSASRVCLEYGETGDLWRMTRAGALALFERTFGPGAVDVVSYGNVLTNVAFLHGLAVEELSDAEFDAHDPYFPALIGIRARKPVPVVSGFSRTPSAVVSGFRRTQHARGLVLLYHRVDDRADAYGMNVPVAAFEAEMEWLKTECTVLPLHELLATPPERLADRAVALTFDDGYLDNLDIAAPILERIGLPATFFVTSRWLEERGEYWWDLLERALLEGASRPAELSLAVNGRVERLAADSPEQRRGTHRQLYARMVHASLQQRDALVAALRNFAGAGAPLYQPMTADHVRALARIPGCTIGAHTVNHLALRDQPDDVAAEEIRACRATTERLLDSQVDLFAYPYGALGGRPVEHVRMEWTWGLSCDERLVPESFDAARVPRIDVGGITTFGQFTERLRRAFA